MGEKKNFILLWHRIFKLSLNLKNTIFKVLLWSCNQLSAILREGGRTVLMIWTIKYTDYPWGSSTASRPGFKLHDTPFLWKCVQSRLHHYLGSSPLPAIAPSFPS